MSPEKASSRRLALIAGGLCVLFVTGFANAQQARMPDPQEEILTFFYKNPKPERLIGFVEKYEALGKGNWISDPPLAGFLAFVFRTNPTQIEQIIPARLTAQSATTIATALRLAGNQ